MRALVGIGLLIAAPIGVAALLSATPDNLPPQRADVTVEATDMFGAAEEEKAEKPLFIEESNILRIEIPSVMIDVKVSGETWPRESPNCHGGSTCIDPPTLDQAAWYGAFARPSVPSTHPVLIFGHSSATSPLIFNNLPAIVAKDAIIVTTETGVFTYEAKAPELVPYEESVNSKLVYERNVPNKLVLITCNDKASAGTVVAAYLTHAVPR